MIIGVIGASGDLGSQLIGLLRKHTIDTIAYDQLSSSETIQSILSQCDIVHICAPLTVLREVHSVPLSTIVVLHDSVMSSSQQASKQYLNNTAAIVHMLMNEQRSVIVASNASYTNRLIKHFKLLGLTPHTMSTDEHDKLMARSQAPFALLCQVLLPYLYEQHDEGLLTPSGQLLVDTLRARELAWTPETIHSILANPQLAVLINDMQAVISKIGYNKRNE